EKEQASQRPDKDEKIRHPGVLPYENRTQDVINRSNDGSAPSQEECSGESLAGYEQINHGRHPDKRRSNSWHNREDGHECSPKRGSADARDPECDPGQRPTEYLADSCAV